MDLFNNFTVTPDFDLSNGFLCHDFIFKMINVTF